MLLAEVANEAAGAWLAAALMVVGGLLMIFYYTRQLWVSFNPIPTPRDGPNEFITRGEVQVLFERFEATVEQFIGRKEYEQRCTDTSKRIDELNDYMHQRMHDVLGGLQTMMNKVDLLSALVNREIGRREGKSGRDEP